MKIEFHTPAPSPGPAHPALYRGKLSGNIFLTDVHGMVVFNLSLGRLHVPSDPVADDLYARLPEGTAVTITQS